METIIRVSQIFINNKIKILLPNSAHSRKHGGALPENESKIEYNVHLYMGIVYIWTELYHCDNYIDGRSPA
jgi:hypothetical protein